MMYVQAVCYHLFLSSGMRQCVSVDSLITYLKQWCTKPKSQSHSEEESEGASFTTTIQHIHNMYTYLYKNCPPSSLKELFQHTPAVFIEYSRYNLSSL